MSVESPDLCRECRHSLRSGGDREVGGILVRSAYRHEPPVREYLHRLKYAAVTSVPASFVSALVALLPDEAAALVPVPRMRWRTLRFGVDPGQVLAHAISRRTGLEVVNGIRPPIWRRPQVGRRAQQRTAPTFGAIRPLPRWSVLVDDVVTTGQTIRAAGQVGGPSISMAVTLTTAGRVRERGMTD
jgi:predicted amidophosphoribosyltransferase